MSLWLLFDLATAFTVGLMAFARWGYPWQLATLTGVAAGALAYTTHRTYSDLRQLQEPAPGRDDDDS